MNMRPLIKPLLLSLIVFLTGCFSHEIRHGLTPDQVKENNSIVILSTGAKETSFSHPTMLFIRRIEDGKLAGAVDVNTWTTKSNFPDHHGFLHILPFEPGKYFFTLKSLHPGRLYEEASSVICFEVRENEVVYVGEVFWEYFGKDFLAISGYAQIVINDQFDRDVGIFLEKNPSFKLEDIRKRIPGHIQ